LQKIKLEILETLKYSDFNNDLLSEKTRVKDLSIMSNYSVSINSDSKLDCNGVLFDVKVNEIGSIEINVSYLEGFIKKSIISYLVQHFKEFIVNLENNMESDLSEYILLPKKERHQLLEEFNDTEVKYQKDKTIVDLFEEQVTRTPNNVAIEFKQKELTYIELNEKVNRLANYISSKHSINKGDIIGVFLPKSDNGIISLLAILKLGAVYLPIDTNYPQERINYLIEDSSLNLLITDSSNLDISNCEILNLKAINFDSNKRDNLNLEISSKDLAYVIYTSGSTGQPKGVMVTHNSNVNMSSDQIKFIGITESDKVVWFASVAFDATIYEIMMSLYSGATLCIPTEEIIKDKDQFISFLKETKASVVTFPPSYLGLLSEKDISGLRCVITAGESANTTKAIAIAESGIDYYNAYGPTECAVCVSIYKVTKNDFDKSIIPIGRPISNTQIYILDEALEPLPLGVTGKMYVSGAGVARGYLNNPELTKEKFIANPFIEGERMYDTGDLARWLPDGNIEFLGRKDQQVKIRGYRIELGEVESIISQYSEDLRQVVVESKEINSEKSLVAYFISTSNIDKSKLQEFLQKKLPEYMVPSFYVALEKLPLTPNGKIDRKALPGIDGKDLIRKEYVAPRTEMEELLVSIWSEVLKHENIGIKDNFYNLGGDSIKIIQIVSLLKEQDYILKVTQILQNPFIEDLAKLVESNAVVIDQSEVEGLIPLTPIQNYFFESEMIPNKNHYNQSVILRSKAAIDSAILEQSISTLVLHHDALRMIYKFENNSWFQYNEDSSEAHYKIKFYDLREESNELESLHKIGDELQSSLNIGSGVLFYVGHFRMTAGDHLALIIHHLVIDGVSWRILFEDIANLYESYQTHGQISLPLKTDSFQRWALLQKDYALSEKMQMERLYWEEVSKEIIPMFPRDYICTEKISIMNRSSHLILDTSLTQKLQTQVHHVYNTEINDILLTGLGLAIRDVFGIQKSIVKMEGHGREEIIEGIDIGRTVGWFTSIYPFVLDISDSNGNELVTVQESLQKIPNKGVGYGILNYLDKRFSNELIPSIQFNYLGDFGSNVGRYN
ncbi:MAG: amino acid adenylation domain-containing protein, partial [Melioribacteraceae bacterium]